MDENASSAEALKRLSLIGEPEQLEAAGAALFEAGAGGLVEGPSEISVYAQNEEELALFQKIALRFPQLEVEVSIVESDWQSTWQNALEPVRVSASFTLRPTHSEKCESDEPENETIWFQPEASFGSGGHETTRLAATWVEEHFSKHRGATCFDVGTGTGVLAFVALKSGASSVLAVDIDQVAVDSARRNAELNSLSEGLRIEAGSADATEKTFPVVLANINTHILADLKDALVARVAPEGTLMLTGLLVEDIGELEGLFASAGLNLNQTRQDGEWALLTFTRPG